MLALMLAAIPASGPSPEVPPLLSAADKDYHLGTADPKRIKLVRLGWTDQVLV
jgi:hypothetical protein